MESKIAANDLRVKAPAGSSPALSARATETCTVNPPARIMTEKDARRGRAWVKKMRKKGYRVEFVGDETNKDILRTGRLRASI